MKLELLKIIFILLVGFMVLNLLLCGCLKSGNSRMEKALKLVSEVFPNAHKKCRKCLAKAIVKYMSPKQVCKVKKLPHSKQVYILSKLYNLCNTTCGNIKPLGGYKCVVGNDSRFDCVFSNDAGSTLEECKRSCPGF